MTKEQPNYPIKVMDKSLSVLELLLRNASAMSITEISEKLGIYPSVVHRILDTLRYWGYVEQDPITGGYSIS